MIRLRQWSVLILAVALAPAARAQDKPAAPDKSASSWAVYRILSASPQAAPMPALKYRLLPLSWELKEGNAVPIYLRLSHEQNDAARKYWSETPEPWNNTPLDKIPLAEARKFLDQHRFRFLRQIEIGARRRTAEWNYTIEEPNPIGLLLPDCQAMRNYAPMLILQVRVALAEGNFTAAAHHLQTGYAFCRHIAEGPTLIHSLIAFAVASRLTGTLAEFVERPDAPNLYWALATLPRPLIDIQRGLGFEYRTFENQFPDLADIDRERTAEQWDDVLRRVRTDLYAFAEPGEGHKQEHPEWYPKDYRPEEPAAKSPDLPAARKFVARTKGLTADKVEAMPPAQVLLLYMVGTYQEDRDDWYRASYLPYPQARPLFDAALKRLREAPVLEGHIPGRLLLPALDKVIWRQNLFERDLALLQTVEALRMYAAAHDGKLPDKLGDVTEVPIPNDPGSDRPFEYSRKGDTATLLSQIPDDRAPNNGVRYSLRIRTR